MIDSEKLREEINARLDMLYDSMVPQAESNRMKCFHQGQADAFEEVLEMIEEMDEELMDEELDFGWE